MGCNVYSVEANIPFSIHLQVKEPYSQVLECLVSLSRAKRGALSNLGTKKKTLLSPFFLPLPIYLLTLKLQVTNLCYSTTITSKTHSIQKNQSHKQ